MAVHLIGLNPGKGKGELLVLRDSLWCPIWEYCQTVLPELKKKVEFEKTESGLQIEEDCSVKLSQTLKRQYKTGEVYEFEKRYNEKIKKLQEEKGIEGTFIYNNAFENVLKVILEVAKKKNPAIITGLQFSPYFFSTEILSDFIEFLENCGGFRIL